MNSVFLEMRQGQCSHPDVHFSKLEDTLIQNFCLCPFSSSVEVYDCLYFGEVIN